ncbi:MAG: hypothetical protein JNK94_00950 [Hyphomonadaceae bacterium]|nr:hypothetical protein [Hyphomonadaceae bacterium]
MRGTILGAHDDRGVLLGADDQRREFALSEWRSGGVPVAGQVVDFNDEAGEARAIYVVPGAAAGAGRHSGAFVLGAIAVGCLALGFIIPVLPTVAAFILGAVGAAQAQQEKDDTALLLSRIAWIGALVLLAIGAIVLLGLFALIGTVGFAALVHGLGPGDL